MLNGIIRSLMSNYHTLPWYARHTQPRLTYKGDEIIIKAAPTSLCILKDDPISSSTFTTATRFSC